MDVELDGTNNADDEVDENGDVPLPLGVFLSIATKSGFIEALRVDSP